MDKCYRYAELTEEAKQRAAKEVFKREIGQYDGDESTDDIQLQIQYILEERQLKFGDIPWEDHYGVSADLRSVEPTPAFYKSFLSEEQFLLLSELDSVADNKVLHITFDGDDAFTLEAEFNDVEAFHGLPFLMEYGTPEEKAEFAFVELLDEELDEDEEERLRKVVGPLAERKRDELEKRISAELEDMEAAIVKCIKSSLDYKNSVDYYADALDSEGTHVEEKYRFTEEGTVAEVDGVLEWVA